MVLLYWRIFHTIRQRTRKSVAAAAATTTPSSAHTQQQHRKSTLISTTDLLKLICALLLPVYHRPQTTRLHHALFFATVFIFRQLELKPLSTFSSLDLFSKCNIDD